MKEHNMSASHHDLKKEYVSPKILLIINACTTKDPVAAFKYFNLLIDTSYLSNKEIIYYAELFDESNIASVSIPLEKYYKSLDIKTREEYLRKRYDRIREDKPLIAINVLQQIKAITQVSPAEFRLEIINQYRWLLRFFAGNKKIRNRIATELDKEILTLGNVKGDFEHLLNIKYRLCIPFKLDTQNVDQAITSQLNEATECIKKCAEVTDVLVHDVDSQRMADIQKRTHSTLRKKSSRA